MLNKELLLISRGKMVQFPPDLEEFLKPKYIIVALTVNKGTSKFDTDSISLRYTMMDADGNELNKYGSLDFSFNLSLGCYIAQSPTTFDHFDWDHSQPQIAIFMPSENEVFASYRFEDVYVQPSEDTSSVGWRVVYKGFNAINKELTVQIESSHSPRPSTIGLVIDLTV